METQRHISNKGEPELMLTPQPMRQFSPKILRAELQLKGWDHNEFRKNLTMAFGLFVSNTAVLSWINGESTPRSREYLAAVADLLDKPIDHFYVRVDSEPQAEH